MRGQHKVFHLLLNLEIVRRGFLEEDRIGDLRILQTEEVLR
jgi:hypothetical protein